MAVFFIGTGIGLVLTVVYLAVGAISFLRIRRELSAGSSIALTDQIEPAEVALVPGFGWKAALAVLTSLVALVVASFSGVFWYVLALSGLGTAAAVIVAFTVELRNDRAGADA